MKLNYYPETDSLYINLSSKTSTESIEISEGVVEISEGVVIDYDEEGHITGIDIDNASRKIDLKEIIPTRETRNSCASPQFLVFFDRN